MSKINEVLLFLLVNGCGLWYFQRILVNVSFTNRRQANIHRARAPKCTDHRRIPLPRRSWLGPCERNSNAAYNPHRSTSSSGKLPWWHHGSYHHQQHGSYAHHASVPRRTSHREGAQGTPPTKYILSSRWWWWGWW